MKTGIKGKIIEAHFGEGGKLLNVNFKSEDEKEYCILGLSPIYGDATFDGKYLKFYHKGKCSNQNQEWDDVPFRIRLPMHMKLPYHIKEEDLTGQEADLYID